MNKYKDNELGDLFILEENDTPGASLHGKKPRDSAQEVAVM